MIPGLTNMLFGPSRSRWALKVALIVPLNNRQGAESSSEGVTGAGSKPVIQASLSMSVPAAGPSWVDITVPKAV
jgi:hypothetical protein